MVLVVVRLVARLKAPAQRLRAPQRGVPFGLRSRAPHVFIRRVCARQGRIALQGDRFGEVNRITFQMPAATPIKKNTIRNAGLVWSTWWRAQPIPRPIITAETNSLPACNPSDMAEPVALASVFDGGVSSEGRAGGGRPFTSPL